MKHLWNRANLKLIITFFQTTQKIVRHDHHQIQINEKSIIDLNDETKVDLNTNENYYSRLIIFF